MSNYHKLIAAIVGVVSMILGPAMLGLTTVELDAEKITQTIFGLLTAFGVWKATNTPEAIKDMPNKQKGFATQSMLIVMLCLGALGLTGCAGTQQAYKAAEGLEETAFVMNQHYLALTREANRLADAGAIRGSTLTSMQGIVRDSRPLLRELSAAARAYEAVRNAENEAELTAAISAAAVQLSNLVNAIKQAGGSAQHIERTLTPWLNQPEVFA